MAGRTTNERCAAPDSVVGVFYLLATVTLAAVFSVSSAIAGGRILIQADELDNGAYNDLVILPDGSVFHLVRLHLRALFDVYNRGDTLVYNVDNDSLIVRRHTSPSQLLLEEPLASVLIEPAIFAGINVGQEVAIFEDRTGYFYSSLPGYRYSAEALDGRNRLIFVGSIVQPYTAYQPSINPFQPDSDVDGVPDAADNCIYMPNGPLAPDAGNNLQLDTDGDGFGNACDADLNNDLFVNFADLDMMRQVFFTNPGSPNWNPDADFDGDEVVNFADLDLMRAMFFGPPGPSGLVQ